MATMSVKKPEKLTDEILRVDQRRPTLSRFRLQVDGQTKASFATLEAAEKVGKEIKAAHPVVRVSVYDAEGHEQKLVGE